MAIGPGEIRALPADFQTLPTVILQVYQRGYKPSHELEIIIVNTAFISRFAAICEWLDFTSRS